MAKKVPSILEIRKAIRGTTVLHSSFIEGLELAQACFDGAGEGCDPRGMLVLGESGSGKSRLLEEIRDKHPCGRSDNGVVMPVLFASIPPSPTVKGLATELLYALGDPLYDKDTEQVKTIRLRKLMKAAGVKMLVLDEFQHFAERGERDKPGVVANWLKALINLLSVSLIVAGLPYCKQVLDRDEQLARRFHGAVVMPSFDWKEQEQRDEFVAVLGAMQESIDGVNLIDMTEPEVAFRICMATDGRVGLVTNLLIEAAKIAIETTGRKVTLKVLEMASQKASYGGDNRTVSPFQQKALSGC